MERRDALATAHDTKLASLLDGVDGVRAGARQSDHLRLRGFRAQQKRGEIGCAQRVASASGYLPSRSSTTRAASFSRSWPNA